MECFWCNGKTKNITLDENNEVIEIRPCNKCNQPERSKREDLTSISEPSEECKKAMVEFFWR